MQCRSSVIYNIFMIAFLLLAIITTDLAQPIALLPIRAGVAKLQMGTFSKANYNILYNKELPDNIYNSVVSVSYANNIELSNGLVVDSSCPNATMTGLGCTVTTNSGNQDNLVYVSYVVSDVGSLLVGSYQQTFSFQNTSTSLSQALTFKPLVDSNYINNSNALVVNFYPFIAGVSTLDPDFSLTIDSKQFNALTLEISFGITIKEMHAKNVTVTFGFLLYDASAITVSLYKGQKLTPNNIASGYIYGIASIVPQTTSGKRRLQVVPNPPGPLKTNNSASTPSVSSLPTVSAFDAANVEPTIITRKSSSSSKSFSSSSSTSSSTSSSSFFSSSSSLSSNSSSKATIVMATTSLTSLPKTTLTNPSPLLLLLKSQPNLVILTPRQVNGTLYTNYMQPNGVIQATPEQDKTLQTLGVVAPVPKPQAAQSQKVLQGIDNQLFNTLFSTNGFVIMTSADDVDQIYYYEVNPVQGYATPAAPPQPAAIIASPTIPSPITTVKTTNQTQTGPVIVYYASTVTKDPPVTNCPRGVIAGREKLVDYVQEKMVLGCYACQLGMYFDLIRKTCEPFPYISNFLNQIDKVL